MAEIYTKPFESVQAAITLFEQKIDPKKCSTSSNKEEKGGVLKDLSDCSLLAEAKEHEKDLAFFQFDASSKSPKELLTLLNLYRAERDIYKEKFRKSQALFLECEKGEHFFHSVSNLVDDESTKTPAQRQAEMMKRELTVEEENSQKLLKHKSGIQKVICTTQLSNIEAKKQSSAVCTGMEEEFFQSQVQLELLRRYLDETEDLENELLKQMIISDYLHMELKQSKDAQTIFSKTVLSAMNELDFLKSEYEQMNSEKINGMNCKIEMLVRDIQRMREEMSKNKELQLVVEAEEAKTEAEILAQYNKAEIENEEGGSNNNSAYLDTDSNGFCTGITISMEEYEFLILKAAELADGAKRKSTDESEVNKLKRELEDRNAEISELSSRLEETGKRAEAAEEAKLAVESQLRKWRDQRRLRRTASDAVKEYCATKNEAIKQQEKPLLSKLACINPELHGIPSHPRRSGSMHDGRKSKLIPLGKLLKIKLQSSS